MSQDKGKVRFIRVNGRIVPIRPKNNSKQLVVNKKEITAEQRIKKGAKIGAVSGLALSGLATVNNWGKGIKDPKMFSKYTATFFKNSLPTIGKFTAGAALAFGTANLVFGKRSYNEIDFKKTNKKRSGVK